MHLIDGLNLNSLIVSQMCDQGNRVTSDAFLCKVITIDASKITLIGPKISKTYVVRLDLVDSLNLTCLRVPYDECWFWHKRLRHGNSHILDKLAKHGLVRGLPKYKFIKDRVQCIR